MLHLFQAHAWAVFFGNRGPADTQKLANSLESQFGRFRERFVRVETRSRVFHLLQNHAVAGILGQKNYQGASLEGVRRGSGVSKVFCEVFHSLQNHALAVAGFLGFWAQLTHKS